MLVSTKSSPNSQVPSKNFYHPCDIRGASPGYIVGMWRDDGEELSISISSGDG